MKPLDAAHYYPNGADRHGRPWYRHRCILCYLTAYSHDPDVPAWPLVRALRARFGPAEPWVAIARRIGVSDRTLRRWRSGEALHFGTADAVLTEVGLQWWEVWTPDAYPDIAHRLELTARG